MGSGFTLSPLSGEGLCWCRDAGALKPRFQLVAATASATAATAAASPLGSLAQGQGVVTGCDLTTVPAFFFSPPTMKNRHNVRLYTQPHRHLRAGLDIHAAGPHEGS